MNLGTLSRRRFLGSSLTGSMLVPGLLSELLAADSADPLSPKPPHFPGKAKSVIFLFMSGGVSHVDSFDPKPMLVEGHGKSVTLADHPETKGQSQRLVKSLQEAGISAKAYPAEGKNHTTINNDLGLTDDRPTQEMFGFLGAVLKK